MAQIMTCTACGGEAKARLIGEDRHMGEAAILPFPQMQQSWLGRQEHSCLLNYYRSVSHQSLSSGSRDHVQSLLSCSLIRNWKSLLGPRDSEIKLSLG